MVKNGTAASAQYGVANQTDAFFIGANGQLMVAWVKGGGKWEGPVGVGPAGLFPPGAGVAASPQHGVANQTDVFAIGSNGQLHVAWVLGSGKWSGPVGLGPAGLFPPGAAVAASPQHGIANQTDVFAIGNDGRVHVAWVKGGGKWNGPVALGPAGLFPPGAGVVASPQHGVVNQTDVFAIGGNGQLHVSWVVGGGSWNGPVGIGAAGLFPPGAEATASPQYGVANQTDVFAIGSNGQLHVAWVVGGGRWNGPVGIGGARMLPPGGGVAASPQYGVANQTDVFAIGNNGQLHVAWAKGGGKWNGPVGLIPPPEILIAARRDSRGPFIKVDGTGFSPGGAIVIDYRVTSGGSPTTTTSGSIGATANKSGAFTARIGVTAVGVTAAAVKATDSASKRSAKATL